MKWRRRRGCYSKRSKPATSKWWSNANALRRRNRRITSKLTASVNENGWSAKRSSHRLSIDFGEQEIVDILLSRGADVDARADIDANGFGGHAPLFNAVVSTGAANGLQRDAAMTRALLVRGTSRDVRASLRKFLDWREVPGWHEAREATPAKWARGFPEKQWVSTEALRLLEDR